MATNGKGLIFYKLVSEYDGDYTKNCGLLGQEIDGNFHFLRGMDIQEIGIEPTSGQLYLKRLNGEKIGIKEGGSVDTGYKFSYDPDKGVLDVTYPEGDTVHVKGFMTNDNLALGTTDKLTGFGTLTNPLDLESAYLTGTYRPAKAFLDLTKEGSEGLPKQPTINEERFVTKEKINAGGLYYTYDEILKIEADLRLHNSEWRVPTIEDWNNLLNGLECDEFKTHGKDNICFEQQGKIAGKLVKSGKDETLRIDYWEKGGDEGEGTRNETGLSIIPMGSKTEYGDMQGIGKIADLWSITTETALDKKTVFAKRFIFNENGATQLRINADRMLPLRLVKDYNGSNFNTAEEIENISVRTVLPKGSKLIWTKNNVSLPQYANAEANKKIYEEVEANLPALPEEIIFFVNQWNGNKWHKIRFEKGESIVLFNSPIDEDAKFHEWRLLPKKGQEELQNPELELVDTAQILKDEFGKEFEALNEAINLEAETRYNADILEAEERVKAINLEAEARYNADIEEAEARTQAIQGEAEARHQEVLAEAEERNARDLEEAEARYKADIAEAEERQKQDTYLAGVIKAGDDYLGGLITAEREERIASDDEIRETIGGSTEKLDQEIEDRKAEDAKLAKAIENEAKQRGEDDAALAEAIQAEQTNRENAINAEKEAREETDTILNTMITTEASQREMAVKAEKEARELADSTEKTLREEADAELQKQINENKVSESDTSLVVTPTGEENGTKISVKLSDKNENGLPDHIKLDESGLYLDGFFGTF